MKKYTIVLLFTYLLNIFSSPVTANDLYFYHLGLKDGLTQINIMSIYQDEFGAMWFGTTEGLNRYNGKEIQTFRASNDGEGLSQNTVYSIQGNQSGTMYVVADDDLIKYDIYSQKFNKIHQGDVRGIYHKDKSLWVALSHEILRYDEEAGKFTHIINLDNKTADASAIYVSDNGTIWLGTRNGLISVASTGNRKLNRLLDDCFINTIYEDKNHNIWVGTNGDGAFFIKPDGQIQNFRHQPIENSISNNQVRTIIEDNSGKIWIGTFFGLNQYDPVTHQWEKYVNSDNISYSISHSSVFSLYNDKQGTIWVGTYFGGVNYFNTQTDVFRYYGASSTNSNYLSFPFVSKMVEDRNNNLWICTEGGALNSLNLDTRRFSRYMFHSNKLESAEFNNLKCIWYREDKDLLYIGIHSGGLSIFDIKTQKSRYLQSDPMRSHSLPNNTINKMQFYDGKLVLLTQSGLVKMDMDTEKFYPFTDDPFVSGVLFNSATNTFLIDSKGRLWVQKMSGGLISIDLKTNRIRTYNHDDKREKSISRFNISDIFESKKGDIYFATIGSGIFKYNENTDDFENYTEEKNQLMSNYCYSISESPSGKLILLFNKGFSFFDPQNPDMILFRSSINFPLVGFNMGSSVYTTRVNEIFIGGVNGLVSFYEDNLNKDGKKYSIYFDKLYINNKLVVPGDDSGVLTETLPLTSEIVLKPGQNNIAIEFASSNYLQSVVRNYKYKLEGFDRDWIHADSKLITYTNLSPGTYELLVGDELPGKDDNKHIYKLIINVKPPFYLSTLAYFIYFLLIVLIIVAIVKFYSWRTKLQTTLEYERKEKERIEELNNIKFRFFTNISHEFRTPLTLIIGQVETLIEDEDLTPKVRHKISGIRKNANHLQNLITELLDFRKQEQGFKKLSVTKVDLISYITEIYNSFQEYAVKGHIKFDIKYTESPVYIYLDPVQFQKAIYNLLSNAFKYTSENGEIKINITVDEQNAYIRIIDNGIGIPAESLSRIFERFYQLEYRSSGLTLGTGIGLALTKEIILAHKATIDVESTINEGSMFIIALKLGATHFSKEELEYKDISEAKYAIKNEVYNDTEYDPDLYLSEITPVIDKNKPTVLLVDDNEELLNILMESFSPQYNVYTAVDGEIGWEVVLNILPDIVISDVMMPRLSGKELCSSIKNNINTSHIPVILLTAQTSDSEIIDGFVFGADAYITKPFNMKILLSNCNNILKSRRIMYDKFISQTDTAEIYNATNEQDQLLINKAIEVIKKNFDNNDFDMNQLGLELGLGRSKLYTRMKEITGFTPNEFTLNLKLQEAVNLLENKPEMNISDIAFHLGFSSTKYFSKCFKTFYNTTPQDWRKQNKQ